MTSAPVTPAVPSSSTTSTRAVFVQFPATTGTPRLIPAIHLCFPCLVLAVRSGEPAYVSPGHSDDGVVLSPLRQSCPDAESRLLCLIPLSLYDSQRSSMISHAVYNASRSSA